MDYAKIGGIIRDIRLSLNLSQQELAKDICTQGNLSRIEKGEIIPNAGLLHELAQRLNVDVSYFFKSIENGRSDYLDETYRLVRNLIRERNYRQLKDVIRSEQKNELFQTYPHQQFLQWHEGIVTYYVDHDFPKAIDLLKRSLHVTSGSKFFTKQQIEIMNSIAILHYEQEEYEESIGLYQNCLRMVGQSPLFNDPVIKIRLHYNLSKSCYKSSQHDEGLKHAKKGIQLCLAHESLYLLGELYFQNGLCLVALERDQERVAEAFLRAGSIFRMQKNHKFSDIVNDTLALFLHGTLDPTAKKEPAR